MLFSEKKSISQYAYRILADYRIQEERVVHDEVPAALVLGHDLLRDLQCGLP